VPWNGRCAPSAVSRTATDGLTPSPVPAIEDPELARSAGLQWHVDLELLGSAMPRGRGPDGQALFAPGEKTRLTHVRSGRDAITYNAGLLTYVKAGTTPLSRLARPRLREPGAAEWARLLAAQAGLSFGLSPAGRQAETLGQPWESRDGSRIIAEAKSNNTLGSNPREIKRAAAKRVKLADVLRTCWTFCTPASTLPYSDSATPRSASSPPPTWSSPAASPAASASDGAALLVLPRPARPLGRLWRGRKARDGIDERSPMLANPLARIGVLAG
jgi:hypothetical protein